LHRAAIAEQAVCLPASRNRSSPARRVCGSGWLAKEQAGLRATPAAAQHGADHPFVHGNRRLCRQLITAPTRRQGLRPCSWRWLRRLWARGGTANWLLSAKKRLVGLDRHAPRVLGSGGAPACPGGERGQERGPLGHQVYVRLATTLRTCLNGESALPVPWPPQQLASKFCDGAAGQARPGYPVTCHINAAVGSHNTPRGELQPKPR
jgi:hypothetical protein